MKSPANANTVRQLHDHLNGLPAGLIQNPRDVEQLLAQCWGEIDGDEGGMCAEKLFGRTENMSWSPPNLTFDIERHGGTVMASTRAELQRWTLNLASGVSTVDTSRYRQLQPRQPGLDVKPLARDVARLISERQEDPRVKWYEDGRVRVYVGKIVPDNAAQRTVAGRRKRFWESLDKLLAANWAREGTYYKPRNTNVESKV